MSQDEVSRALEREGDWSRLAVALARAGKPVEAFDAASLALRLDPRQPVRELVVPTWSAFGSGAVPWEVRLGSPRRLGIDVAPAGASCWLDLGGGVAALAHHPTAELELVAVDWFAGRVVWRHTYPGMTHHVIAAAGQRIYGVREGKSAWKHELVLIDGRTGQEVAAHPLEFEAAARRTRQSRRRGAIASRLRALQQVFHLRASGPGRVVAAIAGEHAPDALRAPSFELPYLLVPEILEASYPMPLRSWGDVRGHALVGFDGHGWYCCELGLRGSKWQRFQDELLATTENAFVFWRPGGRLQGCDPATGATIAEGRLSPEVYPKRSSPCTTQDRLVFTGACWVDQELREARIVAVDALTLEVLWERPDSLPLGPLFATPDVVLRLGPPEPEREVLVLDARTGVERTRRRVPWAESHGEERPGAETPSQAYSMLLGGRLIVRSDAGTFAFDGP